MSMEIHGWIALASSANEWGDDDFADAFERVAQLVADLPAEDGYVGVLGDADSFPRMVYVKGIDVDGIDTARRLIQQISTVFDRSYGELAVADCASLEASWSVSNIRRYCIASGVVRPI
jgi:hypothetical protein